MRCRHLLPALLVGLVAGSFAVPASAGPTSSLCHEDDASERGGESRAERTTLVEELKLAAVADEDVAPLEMEELVLPCAMVESDQLGPWCVDATVYLVTTSGTLLCRVSLPAVDLALSSSPDLEDKDSAPLPQRVSLDAPAGSLWSALKDATRPLVLESVSSLDRWRSPPQPVFAEPPFVPG